MLKKVESLIITDDKYDEAIAFFKDRLGFEMPSASQDMARFELGGFPIFLAKSDKGAGSFISIETDDIEADFEALAKRGVEFQEPINSMKGGDKAAFFKGPANTVFMLYQPSGEPGEEIP